MEVVVCVIVRRARCPGDFRSRDVSRAARNSVSPVSLLAKSGGESGGGAVQGEGESVYDCQFCIE